MMERKKKILIVDDDPSVNELMKEVLEDAGYETVSVFDGLQGVQFAQSVSPDLILLDINLPAGSGENVYTRLKTMLTTKKIPVVIMTGESPDRIRKFALEKNIDQKDIYLKPVNITRFVKRIGEILGDL
ncbi:MAG: response regulator transcription factor [Elusimicrobia bacterium]|nr:response regulator transcription factor [Elusimicrobiota bacterium]